MNSSVWILFNVLILSLLALDLFWFNRKAHVVSVKEALGWSAFWIGLAAIFNVVIYYWLGSKLALEFTAGYLIEKSLSVDNLFVFLMLFAYFKVPAIYQHKVLFWGILGAIVFRAIFIFAGIELLNRFSFMVYILGAFLIFAGIKMFFAKEKPLNPEKNVVLAILRLFIPVTNEYHEANFWVKIKGILHATPLFVVLIIVETTDIVFAIDSVPAVLAISKDPFIVYSSNIFALLGLRSLFFALAGVMELFHYLKYGLALILAFVGSKIVISHWYHLDIVLALGIVGFILIASVVLSLSFPKKPQVGVPQ
ncbi:TerC family protein [Marivirga sp. S37H4]|uniref:TerC family protein n=1 Tax=Marivirga aurantiaca TaxID=2802615 RepID=A0A934X183_9BACT|nr:TerC family protein [Marivirga aurantiaca]MBK6267093.1 TerC family protein [Marivirga aurantiaca]